MLAIPPNRQSVPIDAKTGRRIRAITKSVRIDSVVAVLIGAGERGWCQYAPAASDADTKQCSPTAPQSQQNAIRFVARNNPTVTPKAVVPAQPSPVVTNQPTNTPPLTIADYKNYIKQFLNVPHSEVRPATLPAPSKDTTQLAAAPISKQVA